MSFTATGLPVDVIKVADAGRFRIVETKHARHTIKLLVPEGAEILLPRHMSISIQPTHKSMKRGG